MFCEICVPRRRLEKLRSENNTQEEYDKIMKNENENTRKIPLYNNKYKIVGCAIVDKEDYDDLIKGSWYITSEKYVVGRINSNKKILMHKYLIKKYQIPEKDVVDHKDGIRYNNSLSNLSAVTFRQNAQNKNKTIHGNPTSNYIGVSVCNDKWRVGVKNKDGDKEHFLFENEKHAAYCYDLFTLNFYGDGAKINGIEKPFGFILPEKKIVHKSGEGHVFKTPSGKYEASFFYKKKYVYIGTFTSEEIARNTIIEKKKELDDIEKEIHFSKEITRNKNGIAKIDILSKGEKYECLVDDNKWHEFTLYNWNLTKKGYVIRSQDNMLMHRLLKNAKDDEIIDHVNGNMKENVIDNRTSNLRTSDATSNSHNRTKITAKSNYVGISIITCKNGSIGYDAYITKNSKSWSKRSKTLKEAVIWRNEKAIELYRIEYAKLNPVPE